MEKCIVCGSNKFTQVKKKLRDSDEIGVYICNRCSQTQCYPIQTTNENKEFYSNDMQAKKVFKEIDYGVIAKNSLTDTIRRVDLVKEFFNTNDKIAEIGSGYGQFVEFATKEKLDVTGFEISESRIKIAKKYHGVDLNSTDITDADNISELENMYDGIVAFHVLEHIIEVEKFIKMLLKITKPGSKIILEVPNLDDHMLELSEVYNKFYWQKAHVLYFNQKTLKNLLMKFNLKINSLVGYQRYSIKNMFSWLINDAPELGSPSFCIDEELSWLEKFYKSQLCANFKSDTLIVVIENTKPE